MNHAPTQAYLGHSRYALGTSPAAGAWQPVPASEDPMVSLMQQAGQQPPPQRNLNLWLSGALARPFIAGPLIGLRRWQEVQTILAAMAPEATGLTGPCAVWVAGPVHREACLVVAVPQPLLDDLHRQARVHALRLRSVRPWWSAAFNAARAQMPAAPLWVLDDGEALTCVPSHARAGAYTGTQWPAPDADQRAGWLARLMAGRGLAPAHTGLVRLGPRHASPWQFLPEVPLGAAWQNAEAAAAAEVV
jgi:hypothetical protein